jgi:hypothetical protein
VCQQAHGLSLCGAQAPRAAPWQRLAAASKELSQLGSLVAKSAKQLRPRRRRARAGTGWKLVAGSRKSLEARRFDSSWAMGRAKSGRKRA